MKKVIIKTPGKMIAYGSNVVQRSPTELIIPDDEEQVMLIFLKDNGIDDYEMFPWYGEQKLPKRPRITTKRVRQICCGKGATTLKLNMKW